MRIKVPASTSNIGPGFDTLGLAVSLYNIFEVERSGRFEIEIHGYNGSMADPDSNLFIRSYKRVFQLFGESVTPIKLVQRNNIPVARGLGSSATAIAGGIETACRMMKRYLTVEEKLKIAFEFEPHPDNLLPAFLGGFVIACKDGNSLYYEKLPFPDDIKIVFIVPDIKVSTEEARAILPDRVRFRDAVSNIQRVSLLISSLMNKDFSKLRKAVKDNLHEPYRSRFIPYYDELRDLCYKNGAEAVFISGSGPTVGIFTLSGEERIGRSGVEFLKERGIRADYLITSVDEKGILAEV